MPILFQFNFQNENVCDVADVQPGRQRDVESFHASDQVVDTKSVGSTAAAAIDVHARQRQSHLELDFYDEQRRRRRLPGLLCGTTFLQFCSSLHISN